jgi:hypothetical protein
MLKYSFLKNIERERERERESEREREREREREIMWNKRGGEKMSWRNLSRNINLNLSGYACVIHASNTLKSYCLDA